MTHTQKHLERTVLIGVIIVGALACPPQEEDPQDAAPDQLVDLGAVAPPHPCGPMGEAFSRCAANPLYTAGNAHRDGRLELFIADPSIMFDEDEQIWKGWWQSPLESDSGPTLSQCHDAVACA